MNAPRDYETGAAPRTVLDERLRKVARDEGMDLQRLRRRVAFDHFLARLFVRANPAWVLR